MGFHFSFCDSLTLLVLLLFFIKQNVFIILLSVFVSDNNLGVNKSARLPVSDRGSLARDPSLLMVLMTKFFSRVKLVRPTDSELSITKTMSRGPHRFSQSADKNARCEVLMTY